MFEIGKSYQFVWLETGRDDDGKTIYFEASIVYEIGAVDGTLVKVLGSDYSKPGESKFGDLIGGVDRNAPRDEKIINTASLFFVRAEAQNARA